MTFTRSRTSRQRVLGTLAVGLVILFGWRLILAQQSDDGDYIPVLTSINALMVALVDHSAHEIWEAGSAATLTSRD